MPQNITLGVGQKVSVAATFQDGLHQPAPDQVIAWLSSAPLVATAPSSGAFVWITARAPGVTTITATSGLLVQEINVTVVSVFPSYLKLALGSPSWP